MTVNPNIVRTLLERGWIRVVGHRDVPGQPAMFGTTREFLDYFGLKSLDELPPLAELKDGLPELSPQTDLIEALGAEGAANCRPRRSRESSGPRSRHPRPPTTTRCSKRAIPPWRVARLVADADDDSGDDDFDLSLDTDGADFDSTDSRDDADSVETESADVIPLRAAPDGTEPAE